MSPASMTRRTMLTAVAAMAATPSLAQECQIGVPPHEKGPPVFMDYDLEELDAAYSQEYYEPLGNRVLKRLESNSAATRARLGEPQRVAYGEDVFEKLDIYRADRPKAPIFVFIHGGLWRFGSAAQYAYPAEMFLDAGAHYVTIDFDSVTRVNGDLGVLAAQVRRAIAWVYRNAASFDGDPDRLYIGGHSSGGHLCGITLVTNWQSAFGLPADLVKGGLCMSGMYDLEPVRLSWRRNYIAFTDAMVEALSAQRHIAKLNAPVVVTYGTYETPEFIRQSRAFAAAIQATGKPVTLIEAQHYHHNEMVESLGNAYGPNGRAALAMMGLAERS
ncbi:alpha/beta hydrolase [Dongia deserti]|uniref:alpha/beta hydrolase n=1 Tax=Dongia deserti TaxID=2268030 RepID=UPI000E6488CB|nr:alpha/beta hydrolase [Dongia deserti]